MSSSTLMDYVIQNIHRVQFLKSTLIVDCDRGQVSFDVTRDGKMYIEGLLGILKGTQALEFLWSLGTIEKVSLYHHESRYEELLKTT